MNEVTELKYENTVKVNSLQCKKQLKLLHITNVPFTLDMFFRGQIAYMKAQGLEVHVLCSPGELMIEFSEREKIPAYAVTVHRQITPLQDIYAIFQIWQHLRKIRPEIIHAHTPKGGILGTISAWLAGVPVRVYHIRGLPFMTAKGYRHFLLRWSEKVSCLFANQVLCVSHSIREVAVSEGICPAAKVKVLLGGSGNGVDAGGRFNTKQLGEHSRQETRRKHGIPADALVVGFVGRIVHDKGIAELVAAWKTLHEEFPSLHLLMVGFFEPRDAVSSDVKHFLESDPHIHLTGRVKNTAPLYAAMDIVVLPTYREGLPNVPLEAAAMQLPVVATRISGCIDAVQDGITGILVPPRNAEALVDPIRTYLNNSDLRHRHGQAGRDRVLRDFRQEAIWEALYQEYVQLLREKGLPVPGLALEKSWETAQ